MQFIIIIIIIIIRKVTISFVISVILSFRPHGTTRSPLVDIYVFLENRSRKLEFY